MPQSFYETLDRQFQTCPHLVVSPAQTHSPPHCRESRRAWVWEAQGMRRLRWGALAMGRCGFGGFSGPLGSRLCSSCRSRMKVSRRLGLPACSGWISSSVSISSSWGCSTDNSTSFWTPPSTFVSRFKFISIWFWASSSVFLFRELRFFSFFLI